MWCRSVVWIALTACGRVGFQPSDATPSSEIVVPPGFFTVGGSATGASAGLVLQDNATDDLAISADGPFTFATALADGASYQVTIAASPAGSTCYVGNPVGVVATANVNNVGVTCVPTGSDPGVACGGNFCTVVTEECCLKSGGNGMCHTQGVGCSTSVLSCDDAADCPVNNVCCAIDDTGVQRWFSNCMTTCTHPSLPFEIWCDPAAPNACPLGLACTGTSALSSVYRVCQ